MAVMKPNRFTACCGHEGRPRRPLLFLELLSCASADSL